MLNFYFVLNCPKCDEEVHYGVCITLLEHRGLPVIPIDMAGQSQVDCEACGAQIFVGELDMYSPNSDATEYSETARVVPPRSPDEAG